LPVAIHTVVPVNLFDESCAGTLPVLSQKLVEFHVDGNPNRFHAGDRRQVPPSNKSAGQVDSTPHRLEELYQPLKTVRRDVEVSQGIRAFVPDAFEPRSQAAELSMQVKNALRHRPAKGQVAAEGAGPLEDHQQGV